MMFARSLVNHARGSLRRSLVEPASPFSSAAGLTVEVDKAEPVEVPTIEEEITAAGSGIALKPREIVAALDQYIVGQKDAKRAVAIAMRNRWRRHLLPAELKQEVIPKNILMIGPTGCGKTEIARRISKLSQAPFIKVEATKFTEVGFHGRDVDQIIRDLVEASLVLTRKKRAELLRPEAQRAVEDHILDTLTGSHSQNSQSSFREMLRQGVLDDRQIDVDIPTDRGAGAPSGAIQLDQSNPQASLNEFLGKFQKSGGKRSTERKKMSIRDARPIIEEIELEKLMDSADIQKEAIKSVEESGIVFIDEIDKIASSGDYRGADASAEGVQRDLLPLIEGCSVTTKYGDIQTDHILFIASGAFHSCKPSDLLAELQGRLPIRVELKGLTEEDMYRILTEPITNVLRQQEELLATEQVKLEFTEGAKREIARVATVANKTVENIGARRLHTVLERIIEEISFDACDSEPGATITIDEEYVTGRISEMLLKSDMSKFIL